MSWVKLTPKLNNKESRGDQTRVSVFPSHLVVRIGRTVQNELRWPLGSTVSVLFGKDRDAGKMRLELGDVGWQLSQVGQKGKDRGTFRIKVAKSSFRNGQIPDVPERVESTAVEPQINAAGIEFVVPWHQPAAAAVTAAEQAPLAPAEKAAAVPTDKYRPISQQFKKAKLKPPASNKPPAKAETVEEALARGVKITKVPPVLAEDDGDRGVPVRSTGGRLQGITGAIR
jgi:hypothetical protein